MEYASVLEELWYGNIEPSEYDCSPPARNTKPPATCSTATRKNP